MFVAVSDFLKLVPDQIAPWVPGGLVSLGADGFGRCDTKARLRRYFEIDAENIALAALSGLAQKGMVDKSLPARVLKDLDIDPEKAFPPYA